jgi:hypothetical protein
LTVAAPFSAIMIDGALVVVRHHRGVADAEAVELVHVQFVPQGGADK